MSAPIQQVSLAAVQFACSWDREENWATAERLVREAAGRAANIVLLPELFETPYFCAAQNQTYFKLASPAAGHPAVAHFQRLAKELGVVIPVSIFERAGTAFFNSVLIVDADGRLVGHYRKSHIPQAMEHWRIVMRGHAGANMVPVLAANRTGRESVDGVAMTFYRRPDLYGSLQTLDGGSFQGPV